MYKRTRKSGGERRWLVALAPLSRALGRSALSQRDLAMLPVRRRTLMPASVAFGWCVVFGAVVAQPLQAQMRWTPRDWNTRLVGWNRDANFNFIEDDLEIDPGPTVNVIVDLNRCPEDDDLLRLSAFGTLGYIGKYLTAVELIDVPIGNLVALSNDEAVAMVEQNRDVSVTLDISVRAIKVRMSGTYSPDTVEDTYPTLDGTGSTIAVIDTGVDDGDHESLPAGKFVGGFNSLLDVETNPDDDNYSCTTGAAIGHGTHVASTALGTGGTSETYRGVAPGANLVDIKTMNNCGSGSEGDILQAIDWCVENRTNFGIDVINMSLGACGESDGTDALSQAVNRAVSAGIVVVVAGGNTSNCGLPDYSSGISTPAAADSAITVGNMQDGGTIDRSDDTISPGSIQGPREDGAEKPDVCAPGTDINAAKLDTSGSYHELSGTSMAAPHVAGLAALILQQQPDMTVATLKELLIKTAQDYGAAGWDPAYGHGYVDGFAAIDLLVTSQKTDLGFEEHRNSPDPDPWSSKDISLDDADVVAGVENTVNVRVTNFGPESALNFKVRVGVNTLGNNDEFVYSSICEKEYLSLASPGSVTLSCDWTPDEVPDGTVHACLTAEVVYISDSDFSNNQAQRNVDVKQTASPAVFAFQARNTSGRDGVIDLVPTVRPVGAPWNVTLSMDNFGMNALDCPQKVEVSAEPLVPNAHPIRIDVAVDGVTDQERIHMGGVTFFAQTSPGADCNGNGIHDWIDIRDGTSRDEDGDGVPDSCGIPSPELFGVTWTGSELVRLDTSTGAGTPIGSTGRQLRCAAADSADRILSISSDQLLDVNRTNAAVTVLQNLTGRPPNYVVTGLAIDQSDNYFVLMIENTDDPPGDRLYRLDPTSGVYTLIGPLGSVPGVTGTRGLAFSPSGVLYAFNNSRGLMIVNPSTGAAAAINEADPPDLESLEFDPTTGICYGAKFQLWQIDPVTGALTDDLGDTGYDVRGTAFLRNGRPRLGDCNGDGIWDLSDYDVLDDCLTGPGGGLSAGCSCMDDGRDGDVDLRDVATFQTAFTG